MTATQEYIKKINVSNFNGTICLSEKEFERHLSMFAYRRALQFLIWYDENGFEIQDYGWDYEESWNEFLKIEEHENTTK